jgi:hypothetical protein
MPAAVPSPPPSGDVLLAVLSLSRSLSHSMPDCHVHCSLSPRQRSLFSPLSALCCLTVGQEIVDLALDRLRKLADQCTGLQARASWCSTSSVEALAPVSDLCSSSVCPWTTARSPSSYPSPQVSTCPCSLCHVLSPLCSLPLSLPL